MKTVLLKRADQIPEYVEQVLCSDYCINATPDRSTNFWIMAKAVTIFQQKNNGMLPLSPKIIDMTTTT